MKFFAKANQNEIVWDSKNNKELCRFTNGVIETIAKNKIKVLKSLGYEFEGEEPAEEPEK
jgi:hypothetical protein